MTETGDWFHPASSNFASLLGGPEDGRLVDLGRRLPWWLIALGRRAYRRSSKTENNGNVWNYRWEWMR